MFCFLFVISYYSLTSDLANNLNVPSKSKGSRTFTWVGTVFQIYSTTILFGIPFSSPLANTNYTVTFNSATLLTISDLDTSNISVDYKSTNYLRIGIAYSGTVNTPYLLSINLTISFD